jgi:alanyl-tRNA synthetase
VSSTGEVGLIRYAGQEKIRGRVRLQWKIGSRAWREIRVRERVLADLARELTCGVEEMPDRLRALKAGLKARETAASAAEARLAGLLAERLEAEGPALLPALFQALAASPRTVACLAAPTEAGLSWLLGTSEDLNLDLGARLPALLPLIEGKGGGRGHRCQGTGRRTDGWPALCAELGRLLREAPG